jgi:hypothetical protein
MAKSQFENISQILLELYRVLFEPWHNIALDYLYKNLKAEQLAGHNFSRQQLKSVEKLGPILTSSTIN